MKAGIEVSLDDIILHRMLQKLGNMSPLFHVAKAAGIVAVGL